MISATADEILSLIGEVGSTTKAGEKILAYAVPLL
jgi:hypothetical protein